MKVFISWSGTRSKTVAAKLRDWLPMVIQSVDRWMSREDLAAGTRWNNEIALQLAQIQFGIICLTKGNQSARWLMFEAGALAKTLTDTFVVPYLIDMNPADVESGPLAQFQAKRANKAETLELLQTINSIIERPLLERQLLQTFEQFWPDLEQVINNLSSDDEIVAKPRPQPEVMDEILTTVRRISNVLTPSGPHTVQQTSSFLPWMGLLGSVPGALPSELIVDLLYRDLQNDLTLYMLVHKLDPEQRIAVLREWLTNHVPSFDRRSREMLLIDLLSRLDETELEM